MAKKRDMDNEKPVTKSVPLRTLFADYRPYFVLRAVAHALKERELNALLTSLAANTPYPHVHAADGFPEPKSDLVYSNPVFRVLLLSVVERHWLEMVNATRKEGEERYEGGLPYSVWFLIHLYKYFVKLGKGNNDPDKPNKGFGTRVAEIDAAGLDFSDHRTETYDWQVVAAVTGVLYADNLYGGVREACAEAWIGDKDVRKEQVVNAKKIWADLLDLADPVYFPLSEDGVAAVYKTWIKQRPLERWLMCVEAKTLVGAYPTGAVEPTRLDYDQPPPPKPKKTPDEDEE